jgi:hypothetical protein
MIWICCVFSCYLCCPCHHSEGDPCLLLSSSCSLWLNKLRFTFGAVLGEVSEASAIEAFNFTSGRSVAVGSAVAAAFVASSEASSIASSVAAISSSEASPRIESAVASLGELNFECSVLELSLVEPKLRGVQQ